MICVKKNVEIIYLEGHNTSIWFCLYIEEKKRTLTRDHWAHWNDQPKGHSVNIWFCLYIEEKEDEYLQLTSVHIKLINLKVIVSSTINIWFCLYATEKEGQCFYTHTHIHTHTHTHTHWNNQCRDHSIGIWFSFHIKEKEGKHAPTDTTT